MRTLVAIIALVPIISLGQEGNQIGDGGTENVRPGGTYDATDVAKEISEKSREIDELWKKMEESPTIDDFKTYANQIRTRLEELLTYKDKMPAADVETLKKLSGESKKRLDELEKEIWSAQGELKSRLSGNPDEVLALRNACISIKDLGEVMNRPNLTPEDPDLKKRFTPEELAQAADLREFVRQEITRANDGLFERIGEEFVVTIRKISRLSKDRAFQQQMVGFLQSAMKDAKLVTGMKEEFESGIKSDLANLNQFERVVVATGNVETIKTACTTGQRQFNLPKAIRKSSAFGEPDIEFVKTLIEVLGEGK